MWSKTCGLCKHYIDKAMSGKVMSTASKLGVPIYGFKVGEGVPVLHGVYIALKIWSIVV